MKITIQILLFLFVVSTCRVKAQEIKIQYLANEGIMIKSEKEKILIDAMFKKEFDHLDVLPDSVLAKMEEAETPYNGLNLILATHVHGDHFNAQIVGNHLMKNNETLFMGPQEVINDFKKNFPLYENISSRIISETPDLFESKTHDFENITIRVLRVKHFGEPPWDKAENVCFLVTIGDKKILHVGDSIVDEKNLGKFGLEKEQVDVAIFPFWIVSSPTSKDIIEKYINPKQILVAHIPPKRYNAAQKYLDEQGYKNTTALDNQFETIIIK